MTRAHHALTGKVLRVFGQLKRKGQLHLVLILPDGTRSYIPAAWTDLASPATPPNHRETCVLAFLPDLLRTRQRVAALLQRIGHTPSDTSAATHETQHAPQSIGTLVCGTAPDSAPLRPTQPRAADPPRPSFGVSDAQAGPPSRHSEAFFNSPPNP